MPYASPIIIVDSEYLVCMDLEFSLRSAGYSNLRAFTSSTNAQRYIRENNVSLGVISCTLNDPECVETATLLKQKEIPYVVVSGSDKAEAHSIFQYGAWVTKPHNHDAFVEAVNTVLL
jgi:DNA-binding response OmpR family regulator